MGKKCIMEILKKLMNLFESNNSRRAKYIREVYLPIVLDEIRAAQKSKHEDYERELRDFCKNLPPFTPEEIAAINKEGDRIYMKSIGGRYN